MQGDGKKEEKGKKGGSYRSLMKWCHDTHAVHSFCE